MKALIAIVLTSLTLSGRIMAQEDNLSIFKSAQWIAYEELPDSMEVVPGVHGSGDKLGNKCVQRSIVPMFRNEFTVSGKVKNATISICGLGHYELSINGKKIGDRFLAPGWSYYQKHYLYNTYDITKYLRKGKNVIGVIVGNGFFNINRERYRKLVIAYGYPQLIYDLRGEEEGGVTFQVVSGKGTRVTASPITFSSIYGGEDYDARVEESGWDTPGFDDSHWQDVVVIEDLKRKLIPETDYPLKVMQEFEVQRVFKSKTGRTIYDFGQNASGIIRLRVEGNRGAVVRIRPDELVNDDGDVTQRSGGGPYEFNYILKGDGIEEWQPRFTYYGFRYADVEIIEPAYAKGKTRIVELKMLHTRNSSPAVGSFSCSDTLFNRIYELIKWGIKSNMASVATDCPHREKLGWLEQTYLMGSSIHYNYDIHHLYRKVINDMMDSQLDNGLVPDIAPEYVPFVGGFRDSPEWGSAAVIIPWQLYKWYGDEEAVRHAWPMIVRYLGYLESKSDGRLLRHGLGDWYDLGPKFPGTAQLTPIALTASAIYYYDLKLASQMAVTAGHGKEVKKYEDLAQKVREAFLAEFYDPSTGVFSTGSQTAYAMPLYTGIVPEEDREKVLQNLIESIRANDYALTAGDIGYHFLVRVLSESGHSDILYKMNNRTDRPGYGYQLMKGATSLTESWAALPSVSNNHMMLGHLMEWFYNGLGGIYQQENSISYEKIIIAPKPVGTISNVNCSFLSPKGRIASAWEKANNTFRLEIEVPEGAEAKVILPDRFSKPQSLKNLATGESMKIQDIKALHHLSPGRYLIVAGGTK